MNTFFQSLKSYLMALPEQPIVNAPVIERTVTELQDMDEYQQVEVAEMNDDEL